MRSILILLICVFVIGCGSVLERAPEFRNKEGSIVDPAFQMWTQDKSRDGIEGRQLYFSLSEDRKVDFDQKVKKHEDFASFKSIFVQQRCPSSISNSSYLAIVSALNTISGSRIKNEYGASEDFSNVGPESQLIIGLGHLNQEIVLNVPTSEIWELKTNKLRGPFRNLILEVDSIKRELSEKRKETEEGNSLLEIWFEKIGSVSVEGTTLLFRLKRNRKVEFDHEIEKTRKNQPPMFDFYIKRICPTLLSEEAYSKVSALVNELDKHEINDEYSPAEDAFDVLTKYTILFRKDGVVRRIVLNKWDTSNYETSYKGGIPIPLRKLLKEVYLIRGNVVKRELSLEGTH